MSSGGGGNSGGGGGSSGKVSWPSWFSKSDYYMFSGNTDTDDSLPHTLDDGSTDRNMLIALRDAWDNNPYTGATIYDPTDDLAAAQVKQDAYATAVAAFDPDAEWADELNKAIAKYDELVGSTSNFEDQVRLYEESIRGTFNRSAAQFAAGMADIGAINGTGYIWGLALLTRDHARAVEDYASKINAANFQFRAGWAKDAAGDLAKWAMQSFDWKRIVAQTQVELSRITIVAQKEFADRDVELGVAEANWRLEIWQHGVNMLAGVQGGTATSGNSQKDKNMSAIGGALSGAIGGAVTGSAAGPWGAVAGGVLGAFAGSR